MRRENSSSAGHRFLPDDGPAGTVLEHPTDLDVGHELGNVFVVGEHGRHDGRRVRHDEARRDLIHAVLFDHSRDRIITGGLRSRDGRCGDANQDDKHHERSAGGVGPAERADQPTDESSGRGH